MKSLKTWGKHLMHYHDGRFLRDQMFSLFVFNSIERHENNRQGSYFFTIGKFLDQNPPTIEQLKEKLGNGNDCYIQMLRYYARNMPTFFITFSQRFASPVFTTFFDPKMLFFNRVSLWVNFIGGNIYRREAHFLHTTQQKIGYSFE